MRTARTAARQTASTKAQTVQKAMTAPGLSCIFRTGWLVSTTHTYGVKGRRQRRLVADQ